MEADNYSIQCAEHRVMAEGRSLQLQGLVNNAEQDLESTESLISHYSGELIPTQEDIRSLREQLKELHLNCDNTRAEEQKNQLKSQKALYDLQALRADLTSSCAGESSFLACRLGENGTVLLQAASADMRGKLQSLRGHAQRLLQHRRAPRGGRALPSSGRKRGRGAALTHRVHWLSQLQEFPPNWDVPGGHLANGSATPGDKSLCASGSLAAVSLTCDDLGDAADEMEGASAEEVEEIGRGLNENEQQCRQESQRLNAAVRQRVLHLTESQETLAMAESDHAMLMQLSHRRGTELERMVDFFNFKYTECEEEAEQLEHEMCEVIQARQAVFWKFVDSNQDAMIEDCTVGDWTETECSLPCAVHPGEAGERILTRSVITTPDSSTTQGMYGAGCPALTVHEVCNNVPCPQDCEMSEWSEFSGCSRQCGGGDQIRTRTIQRAGLHSGVVCGSTEETRQCNVEPCSQDCDLADWTAWSPCSRRCLYSETAHPGHMFRTRHVKDYATSDGLCPDLEERTEFSICNDWSCSGDMTCTGNQNLIVIMDGSASIGETNFTQQKAFVKALVTQSSLSGDGSGSDDVQQMRFGLLVMGGTGLPYVASQVSGARSALETALDEAPWIKGQSRASEALFVAGKLLMLDEVGPLSDRRSTVVLVTDGGIRQPRAAKAAAKRLRESGVEIMVVLVQDPKSSAVNATNSLMCSIASFPCVDNVLRVNEFKDLDGQTNRFVAALCPSLD